MENLERKEKIELSIRKKFHKELFSKFAKAINEYDLIKPNDKIAVCISGGKEENEEIEEGHKSLQGIDLIVQSKNTSCSSEGR